MRHNAMLHGRRAVQSLEQHAACGMQRKQSCMRRSPAQGGAAEEGDAPVAYMRHLANTCRSHPP